MPAIPVRIRSMAESHRQAQDFAAHIHVSRDRHHNVAMVTTMTVDWSDWPVNMWPAVVVMVMAAKFVGANVVRQRFR